MIMSNDQVVRLVDWGNATVTDFLVIEHIFPIEYIHMRQWDISHTVIQVSWFIIDWTAILKKNANGMLISN